MTLNIYNNNIQWFDLVTLMYYYNNLSQITTKHF